MFKKKTTAKLVASCSKCGCVSSELSTCQKCELKLVPTGISNRTSVAAPEPISTIPSADLDNNVRYAGFWRRAAALFLDQAILLFFQMIILLPGIMSAVFAKTGSGNYYLTVFVVLVWQFWIYTAYFEHSRCQATIGKYLLGLKVTDLRGEKLSFWHSTFRLCIQYVSLIVMWLALHFAVGVAIGYSNAKFKTAFPLDNQIASFLAPLIGFCYVIFNQKKQTLFDKLSGRLVVFQANYLKTENASGLDHIAHAFRLMPQQAKRFCVIASEIFTQAPITSTLAGIIILVIYGCTLPRLVLASQCVIDTEMKLSGRITEKSGAAAAAKGINLPWLYWSIEELAEQLNLKELQLEMQNRVVMMSPSEKTFCKRSEIYKSLNRRDLARKDLDTVLQMKNTELKKTDFSDDMKQRETLLGRIAELLVCEDKFDEAGVTARKALQINPYNRKAIEALEAAESNSNKRNSERLDLKQLKPRTSKGLISLLDPELKSSYHLLETKDAEKAEKATIQECDAVLNILPDCTQAWLVKGAAMARLDRIGESQAAFNRAIASSPEEARPHVEYAQALAENRKIKEAKGQWQIASNLAKSPLAHSKLANQMKDANEYKSALSEISKAIEMDPDEANYWKERAEIKEQVPDIDGALSDLKKSLACTKESSGYRGFSAFSKQYVLSDLASLYARKGDFKLAMRYFDESLALDPNNPLLLQEKGEFLLAEGRSKEAIVVFNRLLEILRREHKTEKSLQLPSWQDIAYGLFSVACGNSWFQLRDTDKSYEICNALKKRGDAHESLGDIPSAIADYLEVQKFEKDAFDPERLAHLYCRLGNYQMALDEYSKSLAETPDDSVGYLKRASLLKRIGRHAESESDIETAIKTSMKCQKEEENAVNYYQSGQVHLVLGDFQAALQSFKSAQKLEKPGYYATDLAKAYAGLHQYATAIKEVAYASASDRDSIDAAAVFLACGQDQTAIERLSEAIRENPISSVAYFMRGTAHSRLKQKEKAAQDFSKAKSLGYWDDPVAQLPL